MIKFATLVIALLLVLPSALLAQVPADHKPVDWIALQAGDQIVTSEQVKQYIEAVVISSDLQASLFAQAGSQFAQYREQKDKLIAELFEPTLARIAILRVLQAQAIRESESGAARKYLTLTRPQMKALIDAAVREALSPFQKTGASFKEAKAKLIESLILAGMPHQAGASAEELYEIWLARLRIRLKEQYRQG